MWIHPSISSDLELKYWIRSSNRHLSIERERERKAEKVDINRKMKFCTPAISLRRIAGSGGGVWRKMKSKKSGAAALGRRLIYRTAMLPAVLMLGLVLPFLFIRTAFLLLESAALCSSSIGNFLFSFLLILLIWFDLICWVKKVILG